VPQYTLPDGETVKIKLGATSHSELEAIAVDFVKARQIEHALDPRIARTFDAAHLKAIHRQLFQDVYDWAGHTRDEQVRLPDGTVASEPLLYRPGSKPFAVGSQVSDGLDALAAKLKEADYLRGLPRGEFAARAASVLADVNQIHAFREGNGRTQRIFMQELAENAGHSFDFRVVSRERMVQASIAAHEDRDIGPMRRMLDEISNPHRLAALTPAIAFLNSVKYPWNDRYVGTLEPGHVEDLTIAGVSCSSCGPPLCRCSLRNCRLVPRASPTCSTHYQ
jgi:cell filamentation protein